jgi:hypothetical protein
MIKDKHYLPVLRNSLKSQAKDFHILLDDNIPVHVRLPISHLPEKKKEEENFKIY